MLSDADALLKLPSSNTAARSMAQMFRLGQRLPPIPHLLSVMVQPKAPRRFPDDEADIKRDDQIGRITSDDERRKEARAGRGLLCSMSCLCACNAALARRRVHSVLARACGCLPWSVINYIACRQQGA